MRKGVKILGTFAVMALCGIAAFLLAATFLMNLGTKLHNNYEYYGSLPAAIIIYACGAVGFVTPGLLAWRLQNKGWQFGLRDLLIAITIAVALIGIYSLSF